MEQQIEARRESTIKDFLEVIFRRKRIILGIVLVATAFVVFINMREPAIYESSAKVLVRRGEQPGVFNRNVQPMTWEEEIASQIEMVKSTIVVNRAQELLADYVPPGYTPRQKLNLARVGAGVVSTSNVIWVTYSANDPVFCQVAVNAIVNSYKEYYQRVRTPPEMEDFFLHEIESQEEELGYWRERKQHVEQQWGVVNFEQQQLEMIRNLDTYRKQLEEVTQDLAEKESAVERLERMRQRGIEEFSSLATGLLGQQAGGNMGLAIEKMRSQLIDLRVAESELAARYTGEHHRLKEIRKQIDDLNESLNLEIESALYVTKTQIDILRDRRSYLSEMVAGFEEESKSYPEKGVELERINAALAQTQDNYDRLVQQHMASKISIASNPEWTVTILNEATPGYRKKTRDYVRIALGPLFSLIIALAFAFFMDNLDHSIKNVHEAEEVLDLAVLASFPDQE